VFDCICRSLILGPDFMRAVRAMSSELGEVPLAGFETYGEIALDVGDMSGFHNTTSVVLAFPGAPAPRADEPRSAPAAAPAPEGG
jgi:methyl-accepting chemotaxis protein